MREIRPYGSVRGVAGDRYPYRDSQKRWPRYRSLYPGHPRHQAARQRLRLDGPSHTSAATTPASNADSLLAPDSWTGRPSALG